MKDTLAALGLKEINDGCSTGKRWFANGPVMESYSPVDGKLNIFQALAQAGDLTTYAKKYPVMVIRENKGRREFGYVNLLSHSVFSSPYYRLQQNDIVYVQSVENKPTVEQDLSLRRLSYITTVLSIITTVTFLILNFTK